MGFADWAEQLIAESTGKLGTGVLPVVAGPAAPEVTSGAADVLVVRLVAADADVELGENEVAIAGGLATQMMVWEFATAVAGRLLGINPFDQPDVEAAKVAARGLLDAQPEPTPAAFVDGAIEVRGGDWLRGAATAEEAVGALLGTLDDESYLSVQAYFDRLAFARAGRHPRPARRRQRPSGHLWLGPAVPALDRAVPQGRPRDRRVPPGHRGSRGGPGHPGPSLHVRGTDLRPGRRATPRSWPVTAARSCACTSPTAPPALHSCRRSLQRLPPGQHPSPKAKAQPHHARN